MDDCAISERGGSPAFGFMPGKRGRSVSLLGAERAIRKAIWDSSISMIYINTDNVDASVSDIEELRKCLKEFSLRKPVVAYATSLDNRSYYLASVADKVFLYPEGEGLLTGGVSAQLFLGDLLDTLGVDVQLIRHGKYKSAGEMFTRGDISPENRQQYERLLASRWDTCVEDMAGDRGVSPDSIKAWSASLALGNASSWMEKGLVDGLKYRDEMEQYICHLHGTRYPSKVTSVELSDYVKTLPKSSGRKKIAVIYADGEITRKGSAVAGESLSRTIASVRADSTVKAVVFRVNSPGGEVVASDMIRREIELLRKDKPVVASYGGYAASGGYLISAPCNTIITDKTTLTGSIGVYGLVMTYGNALKKKLHINPVVIGTGEHSGMGAPLYPLKEDEVEWYQQHIEEVYDSFVGVVADGRGMDRAAVDSIAQGRVWTGSDAVGLGLADWNGNLLDAVDNAALRVNLKKYTIVEYPARKNPLKELLGRDKKDGYLVELEEMLQPGLNTVVRLPFITACDL